MIADRPRQYLYLKNDKDLGICIFRGFRPLSGDLMRLFDGFGVILMSFVLPGGNLWLVWA